MKTQGKTQRVANAKYLKIKEISGYLAKHSYACLPLLPTLNIKSTILCAEP